jgi:hypothetical protein
MNEERPQDNAMLSPDVSEFGNILAGIQIRGALEAIAGRSRTYILFNDKKGGKLPIPKIRFEWHELMIVVDITFLNIGGWTYDLQGASLCEGKGNVGKPLNRLIQNMMVEALAALKHKMETGGSFSNADF